jgi:hypothetical protein
MAVGFDAKMTAGNSADGFSAEVQGGTALSTTGITVGASATCLVATLVFSGAVTSLTVTWNGVGMTQEPTVTSGAIIVYIFRLVSPASGAQALAAAWTTARDLYLGAVSFTGTDTTTGVQVADNTTATNVTAIAIPTGSTGATVAVFGVDGATPTIDQTTLWGVSNFGPGGGASYALGGTTTNTHNFTGAGGTVQALAGVHVIAAAGGGRASKNTHAMPLGIGLGIALGLTMDV